MFGKIIPTMCLFLAKRPSSESTYNLEVLVQIFSGTCDIYAGNALFLHFRGLYKLIAFNFIIKYFITLKKVFYQILSKCRLISTHRHSNTIWLNIQHFTDGLPLLPTPSQHTQIRDGHGTWPERNADTWSTSLIVGLKEGTCGVHVALGVQAVQMVAATAFVILMQEQWVLLCGLSALTFFSSTYTIRFYNSYTN